MLINEASGGSFHVFIIVVAADFTIKVLQSGWTRGLAPRGVITTLTFKTVFTSTNQIKHRVFPTSKNYNKSKTETATLAPKHIHVCRS